jgi:hypothetical protein
MHRIGLVAIPLLAIASSALAADLGPYPEKETYLPPPPPRAERKIVEHHHYYHEAPSVYREKRVYVEPRVYEAPIEYQERPYRRRFAFAYRHWRPGHFHRRQWGYRLHRDW